MTEVAIRHQETRSGPASRSGSSYASIIRPIGACRAEGTVSAFDRLVSTRPGGLDGTIPGNLRRRRRKIRVLGQCHRCRAAGFTAPILPCPGSTESSPDLSVPPARCAHGLFEGACAEI